MPWTRQMAAMVSIFCAFNLFFYWNYYIRDKESAVCMSEAYPLPVVSQLMPIWGATVAHTTHQLFRNFVWTVGYGNKELRHPKAFLLTLCISVIQTFCISCTYFGVWQHTCVDFLGVPLSPFVWMDWLTTVPFQFFLIVIMDMRRAYGTHGWLDFKAMIPQICGGSAIFLLFLCSLGLPFRFSVIAFTLANICMVVGLAWQQTEAYDDLMEAKVICNEIPVGDIDLGNKDKTDRLKIAQCKLNCSVFMSVFYTLFPLWYYLYVTGCVDLMTYLFLQHWSSYLAKVMLIQIVTDCHVDILDPTKYQILVEKKRSEESRVAFLRYVFHEVRVPLNSLSLGLQLLADNPAFDESDQETIRMMRDGTNFMAETLNDVLSLQKIEQGMLQLEMKSFPPEALITSVLSSFRSQYAFKNISVQVEVHETVPERLVGDQFRLEHVLGNLFSNAIKFSSKDSQIFLSVSYDSREKNHITYSVRDQGPGMSPDEQSQLYQPFVQIRAGELQKGRGSGLGLSICKTIMTLHNGTIGCVSQKREGEDIRSGGSEFYFNVQANGLRHELDKVPGNMESPTCIDPLQVHEIRPVTDTTDSTDNGADTDSSTVPAHAEVDAPRCAPSPDSCGSTVHTVLPHSPNKDKIAYYQTGGWRSDSELNPLIDVKRSLGALLRNLSPTNKALDRLKSSSRSFSVCSPTASEKNINNILIVDDVCSNRKMLKMILTRSGFDCEQCVDGADAVENVKSKGLNFYQLILMDSVMPKMCGPDAAKALREMGYKNMLVGVTGNAMKEDILHFEGCGADMVLTKPIKIDALTNLIQFCQANGSRSKRGTNAPTEECVKAAVLT
mmetsp:Transcript_25435/g.56323  ORF Transcript_25435/g.56323 Transcript_25435/m.56323 type:complete len:836 (+) Transcript_25435:140-2647(+)